MAVVRGAKGIWCTTYTGDDVSGHGHPPCMKGGVFCNAPVGRQGPTSEIENILILSLYRWLAPRRLGFCTGCARFDESETVFG